MVSTRVMILYPTYRFEVTDDIAPEDLLRKAADRHWLPSFWDWQRNIKIAPPNFYSRSGVSGIRMTKVDEG